MSENDHKRIRETTRKKLPTSDSVAYNFIVGKIIFLNSHLGGHSPYQQTA